MFRITFALTAALALLLTAGGSGSAAAGQQKINTPLSFTVEDIGGEPVNLAGYLGRVVLIVNTASKCGYTPQYEGLQELYEKYGERGFVVLAFPANDFKQQEPGTDEEIREFCTVNYGVTFPLFSKISVKGADKSPLYSYLTSEETNPGFAGEIPWNFTKFLVGRDGRVAGRYEPGVAPADPELVEAIEKALGDGM